MAAARLAQDFNAGGFCRVRRISASQVPISKISGSSLILYKSTHRQTRPKKVTRYMTRRLGRGSTTLNTNTIRRWAANLWNRMTIPSHRCVCLSFQAPLVFWRQRRFGVNWAEVLSTSKHDGCEIFSFSVAEYCPAGVASSAGRSPVYRFV